MTPLEIAAKAYWNAEPDCLACGEWDGIPEAARADPMKAMRAALLALAEAKLSPDIIGAGATKIAGVRTQHGDGRHLWEARAAFPAMCRAIAEDRG